MNSDDRSALIRRLRSGTLSRRGFVAMAGAGLAAGSLRRPALADPVTEQVLAACPNLRPFHRGHRD